MASGVELATFLVTECLAVAGGSDGSAPHETCVGAYAVEYCRWSPAACWAQEQTAWFNLLQPLPNYTKCKELTGEQATALIAAKIACDVEALVKKAAAQVRGWDDIYLPDEQWKVNLETLGNSKEAIKD